MPRVVITISDQNSQPYRFNLDREKVTIGRSKSNDIVIDCPSVSGLHCTMERVAGGYILRDQDSTNGLRLKKEAMTVIDLRNDIDVFVGDAHFEYSLSPAELDELDEEDFIPHARKAPEPEDPDEAADNRGNDAVGKKTPPPRKGPKNKSLKPSSKPPSPGQAATIHPLPSSGTGGGLFAIATFFCGLIAFYAGLDSRYRSTQEDLGRKGEISLLGDIKDGAPPAPKSQNQP